MHPDEIFLVHKRIYKRSFLTELITLTYIALTFTLGFTISKKIATRELAVSNAYKVINFENKFGISYEYAIQHTFLTYANDLTIILFNNFYLFAHIPCSVIFLLWIFIYHPKHYEVFRNSLLISHTISIITQFIYPCAPPRMLSELGFVDTILKFSKSDLMELEEATGVNPYAAVPSMHFSYAMIVSLWGFYLSEKIIPKIAFIVYLSLVTFGVIVTGNHFIFDCLVALAINSLSYLAITRWMMIKKILKNEKYVSSDYPSYWWLIVVLAFGGASTMIHIITRVVFFVFVR